MPEPAQLHADDDPDESDLAGVPRAFVHSACGRGTQLSAAVVRRVLRDPFRLVGAGAQVWCAACGKAVRSADCRWHETGANVRDYYHRLIGRAYLASPWGWVGRFLLLYGAAGSLSLAVVLLVFALRGGEPILTAIVAAAGVGLVVGILAVGLAARVVAYRRCAKAYREAMGPNSGT